MGYAIQETTDQSQGTLFKKDDDGETRGFPYGADYEYRGGSAY